MGAWTMEALTLIAVTATEKCTLLLDSAYVKSLQSHSSVISRSRAPGYSVCLKSISRPITMQGLTLAAIITSLNHTFVLDSMQNLDKVTGA